MPTVSPRQSPPSEQCAERWVLKAHGATKLLRPSFDRSALEPPIRKVKQRFPTIRRDVVGFRASVIFNAAHDWLFQSGHLLRRKAIRSQQAILRIGICSTQKLAAWICPCVSLQ